MGPFQCRICRRWFHYEEDETVCRECYRKFKLLEIYDRPNELFGWATVQSSRDTGEALVPKITEEEEE